jgi:hypothetical protein
MKTNQMHEAIGFVLAALLSTIGCAAQQNPTAIHEVEHRIRIELIGDSTQTDNAGYGRGFCANLTTAVDCINLAKGGASTKTFRSDGLWEKGWRTRRTTC